MHLLAVLVLGVTPGIRTPSGNIGCFVSHATLHCSIAEASYRPALQALCLRKTKLDWHGFELSRIHATSPTCSGGILYDTPPRYHTLLAYWTAWRSGTFTCVSRITGLTCTAGAHGLFISRRSWRGW